MLDNEQDLVKVLETELRFLDNGGYRNPDMWRPQFIFLDSATCVHPAGSGRPEACADCPLIGFVPRARRSAPVPCHHIPLTKEGFNAVTHGYWLRETDSRRQLDTMGNSRRVGERSSGVADRKD